MPVFGRSYERLFYLGDKMNPYNLIHSEPPLPKDEKTDMKNPVLKENHYELAERMRKVYISHLAVINEDLEYKTPKC